MSFQQLTIVGRLGDEPSLRYMPDGKPVCNFDVACNPWKDKTIWHRVAVWGNQAESCNQWLHKGSQVMVIGTVEARGYTNSAGKSAASLELRARDVRFLGGRGEGESAATTEPDNIPF